MSSSSIQHVVHFIIKNDRTCTDSNTKKAHKQDWDGTLAIKLN